MKIRQVNEDELRGVLDLIDEYDRPRSLRPTDERCRSIFSAIRQSGGCVVGAFQGRDIIGTCSVNVCHNLSWSGRPYAIIENVIVSASRRRQGIGDTLLAFAIDFARQSECYKVALMTGSKDLAVHRFYESAGFVPSKQGYQMRFDAS